MTIKPARPMIPVSLMLSLALGALLSCTQTQTGPSARNAINWQDSVQYYSDRISSDDSPYHRTRRSLAYQQIGQLHEAQLDVEAALASHPDYAPAFAAFGNLHYLKGDFDDARKAYDKAIELAPGDAYARVVRGSFYYEQGDTESALFDFNAAIGIDTGAAFAYFNRGILHYERGNLPLARSDFDAAIRSDLRFAPAYYARAVVGKAQGDRRRALDDYTTAILLDSTYAEAYLNRGLLYIELNQADKGCPDLEAARKLGLPGADSTFSAHCR
jgi:tetratricopeptide (TPR) repeat protein